MNKILAALCFLLFGSLSAFAQTFPGSVTPMAPSGALTLTTANTSQVLFKAGEVLHGCVIQNPPSASEPISVNFFTTAASAAAGGTTSVSLAVGQTVPCGVGLPTAVSWIATTQGHAINAWVW